jgi:hypothetical protein
MSETPELAALTMRENCALRGCQLLRLVAVYGEQTHSLAFRLSIVVDMVVSGRDGIRSRETSQGSKRQSFQENV